MNPRNRSRVSSRGSITTAMACAFILAALAFTCSSCGSGETEQPEEQEQQPITQEENAQTLGRIMAFRNQLEGELNEPVDVVITGDVTAAADAGEEMWLLVKVVDFRCTSVPQGTLKAAQGSELSIRLRSTEDALSIKTGDSLEINAMISKSTQGPVIIGRVYRVIE